MSSRSNKPNTRLRRAKSEISHNRVSAETLRTEFRARFFSRLRNSRSKSVDRFRQIVEDYGDSIQSIHDVRTVLSQDKVASNLLQCEEVNELLISIEQELANVHLNRESEEHLKTVNTETEDAVNRLLNVCQVCGKSCEGNFCTNCAKEFASDSD